jgi:hypothetical protein
METPKKNYPELWSMFEKIIAQKESEGFVYDKETQYINGNNSSDRRFFCGIFHSKTLDFAGSIVIIWDSQNDKQIAISCDREDASDRHVYNLFVHEEQNVIAIMFGYDLFMYKLDPENLTISAPCVVPIPFDTSSIVPYPNRRILSIGFSIDFAYAVIKTMSSIPTFLLIEISQDWTYERSVLLGLLKRKEYLVNEIQSLFVYKDDVGQRVVCVCGTHKNEGGYCSSFTHIFQHTTDRINKTWLYESIFHDGGLPKNITFHPWENNLLRIDMYSDNQRFAYDKDILYASSVIIPISRRG